MKRTHWSRLCLGLLLTAVIACRPVTEEESNLQVNENEPANTEMPAIAQQATSTPATDTAATNPPPPEPTPLPTTDDVDDWQQIGSDRTGLQFAIPPVWVNLSGELETATATNELGLIVLLAADSARTGSAVLAEKQLGQGAFAGGLITNLSLSAETPVTGLQNLIADLPVPVTTTLAATPVSAQTVDGTAIDGAYADVVGDAIIFSNGADDTRTRLLFFPLQTAVSDSLSPTQALFLFSATVDDWQQYEQVFRQMTETITIHNVWDNLAINDGGTNVLGQLSGETDVVNGRLQSGASDAWTFTAAAGRYATITAGPDDKDIDITFSLINPAGQTIAEIDNGFAGDTETVIDLLLSESGTYVVEISEFFNDTGRYTLSLVLTEDPLFSGGGRIEFGQTIQSELPTNGQKVWRFDSTAGTLISVVLEPAGQFDAILELYGPEGRRLTSLDEGFSGDAEVLSGFDLPVTGEYTILVRSFAGDGGGYSLSLDEGAEETANFYDAGDLVYGDVAQETLQANEAHAWFFNGRSGEEVSINVQPLNDDLDLEVWLLDPTVERLDAQDVNGAGTPEQITHTLPQDGQYLILVTEFAGRTGAYEIALSAEEVRVPTSAGSLTYGEPVNGTLAQGQSVIWYFEAGQGDVIDVVLESDDPARDLLFYVEAPDGTRLTRVDAQDAGEPESLEMFSIPADGRWGIVVEEFFGDVTPYQLDVALSVE